jgi:hypothetical protein
MGDNFGFFSISECSPVRRASSLADYDTVVPCMLYKVKRHGTVLLGIIGGDGPNVDRH